MNQLMSRSCTHTGHSMETVSDDPHRPPGAPHGSTPTTGACRLHEAETVLRGILTEQPNDAQAVHLLGIIANQMNKKDQAVLLIRQAIAVDPYPPAFHNNLGNILREQDRMEDAVAAYQEALRLQPDYADAHNNMGATLLRLNKPEPAIAHIFSRPLTGPILNHLQAHLNLARIKKIAGTALNEAIRALSRSCHSQSIPAAPNLTTTSAQPIPASTTWTWPWGAFQAALKLRPDYPQAHNNLGAAYLLLHRFDEAEAEFRRAIQA